MKKNLLVRGFINALGTAAYIAGISWLLFNGEHWFGKEDNVFMPMLMLLLLVISATITSGLVLGKPILMYLDGEKKNAVKLTFITLVWLVILAAIIFAVLATR